VRSVDDDDNDDDDYDDNDGDNTPYAKKYKMCFVICTAVGQIPVAYGTDFSKTK
jgi:hypothetical protein